MPQERLNGFAPNLHGSRVCPSLGRVWMSRSKVRSPEKRNEKLLSHPHWQCIVRRVPYAVRCKWHHAAADDTIPLPLGDDGVTAVHADGDLRAAYVWWTSLALVNPISFASINLQVRCDASCVRRSVKSQQTNHIFKSHFSLVLFILGVLKHCQYMSYVTAERFIFPAFHRLANGIRMFLGLVVIMLNVTYGYNISSLVLINVPFSVVSSWFDIQVQTINSTLPVMCLWISKLEYQWKPGDKYAREINRPVSDCFIWMKKMIAAGLKLYLYFCCDCCWLPAVVWMLVIMQM